MVNALKKKWHALKKGRPGRRFQDRYARLKQAGNGSALGRLASIALAFCSLCIGIILVFIPGPAVLFFFISGSLLATESRLIATALDKLELALRAAWRWGRERWHALSGGGRAALGIVAVGIVGVFAYASYRLFLMS